MLQRMLGAARLDVRTFEEVEHDQNATFQAALVVIIVSVATGLGALGSREGGGIAFILGLVAGLLQWAVWAYITYLIGTTLFRTSGTRATWGQLARTTGFAQSPGVLKILGFIPVLGQVIFFAASNMAVGGHGHRSEASPGLRVCMACSGRGRRGVPGGDSDLRHLWPDYGCPCGGKF